MTDLRGELVKIKRILGEKLACGECSGVVIHVIGPGETAPQTPNCAVCGRERSVIVVKSPLSGCPGSARLARDETDLAESLRIDDRDPGKVIAHPVPEASPLTTTKQPEHLRAANGFPREPRFVPQHEIPAEPPARAPDYEPLGEAWR